MGPGPGFIWSPRVVGPTMGLQDVVAELARDRSSGASEIAVRAAEALASADDADAVRESCRRLVAAHPAMAPLVHLAADAIRAVEGDGVEGLAGLAERRQARRQDLTGMAAGFVDPDADVVTYSRSGSVLAALQAVAGPDLSVTLSEGRPGGEGLSVAEELTRAGADVTLTTDAGLARHLEDADMLMVGADALAVDGFVNKVGTGMLCLAAQDADAGVLVVAATDKVWPASLGRAPPVDATGSWDVDVPDGVSVDLRLFEVVPLDRVTGVVTEEGPLPPAQVADRARRIDVPPAVQQAVQEAG